MAEVVHETARPQTQAGSRQRKWARWAGRLASALFLLGLGGLLVLLLVTAAELRLWGYQNYVIYGGSMEPTIKRGSLMLAKPVKMDDLQVGDIIAFRKPGNGIRVIHRIVGIREEDGQRYFETKGDANSGRDAQKVSMDDGVQQLAYDLPYLGYFRSFR